MPVVPSSLRACSLLRISSTISRLLAVRFSPRRGEHSEAQCFPGVSVRGIAGNFAQLLPWDLQNCCEKREGLWRLRQLFRGVWIASSHGFERELGDLQVSDSGIRDSHGFIDHRAERQGSLEPSIGSECFKGVSCDVEKLTSPEGPATSVWHLDAFFEVEAAFVNRSPIQISTVASVRRKPRAELESTTPERTIKLESLYQPRSPEHRVALHQKVDSPPYA
jgi:hypothetical protein